MLMRTRTTGALLRKLAYLLPLVAIILGACVVPPPAATAPAADQAAAPAASGDNVTIFGEKLPDDALPYDQQIYKVAGDIKANHTSNNFMESVYQRYCPDVQGLGLALVDLDRDFGLVPEGADSWEASEDGLTWTFKIRPGMIWSDDTPVTANDWVATFRYAADPEHAWDFAWFYSGVIKNWDEVIAGELPVEELGVVAVDDLTLQISTYKPFPPLPGMMKFSWTMQAKALAEKGPFYNSNPETSVTSGRYKLVSIEPGKKGVLAANEKFKGPRPPRLKGIECTYMDTATGFSAFQNGEIHELGYEWLTPADFEIIKSDPILSANYLRHFGDFRTDYLLFDTFNPPFNDVNVRKAFAKAIDRDAIIKNVYTEVKAMVATSFLMPGFPSSDTDGSLAAYQGYDCEAAKKHLADAGFASGADFPKQEMWLRNEAAALQAVWQAVAASISDCLGVEIEVSNKDFKVYMDALNAKPTQLTFGAVSYGMDYLDPTNMLGIFKFGGRHSWKNDAYDALIDEATPLVADPAKRDQMFRDAQTILVDDVGSVFIAHRWQGTLYQANVQGDSIRVPDKVGIAAPHWGNDWIWSDLYLAK